ncbi:phage head closure protein [Cohnella sp. AR92]|uniref:phage head closure protein n=1 Tax=Cohnella sp. AR92 TaxID=648716 RepID=UPI000F8D8AD4|nr:phage head closure protein [Cohnella sp. AR92]RUS47683.1 head-tail adaptor protein [Cohnella sp. AR92]
MTGSSRLKSKKISILKRTDESDSYGDPLDIWNPIPEGENIWAYYRQTSGSEFYAAAAVNSRVEAIFEIRWRDDLDVAMRIQYQGDQYSITRIDDYEGNKNDLRISAYKIN